MGRIMYISVQVNCFISYFRVTCITLCSRPSGWAKNNIPIIREFEVFVRFRQLAKSMVILQDSSSRYLKEKSNRRIINLKQKVDILRLNSCHLTCLNYHSATWLLYTRPSSSPSINSTATVLFDLT